MYTKSQFFEDKVLVCKLLENKRFKEARDLLNSLWHVLDNESFKGEVSGMLLILGVLYPDRRDEDEDKEV